jgi:hypothetical protein
MADRDDDYRGYGHDTGRYAERGHFERDRMGGGMSGGGDYRRRDHDDDWRRERGGGSDWRGSDRNRGGGDDRGFFERAGEQVRSWFEDDDDHDRQRGQSGGGWRGGRDDRYGENQRSFGGGRNERYGAQDQDRFRGRQDAGRQPWGGGDRGGGDFGREYSTGRYGSGGGAMGGSGDYRGDRDFGGDRMSDRARGMGSSYGGQRQSEGQQGGRGGYGSDDHYHQWRQQQIEALDRDYDEYRNESRQKFHSEFGGWREQRQQQRGHLGRVREHMEVVGSDGERVGTVDKVSGDRIILTKNDPNAGGHHHSIPCSWIQTVDERVTINKSSQEAIQQWRDEENRRALFERPEDRQNDGPHILDRSFSGTYDRGDQNR